MFLYHNTVGLIYLVDIQIKIIIDHIPPRGNTNRRSNQQKKETEFVGEKYLRMYGRIKNAEIKKETV